MHKMRRHLRHMHSKMSLKLNEFRTHQLHKMRRHLRHMDHPLDLLCHPLQLGCSRSEVESSRPGRVDERGGHAFGCSTDETSMTPEYSMPPPNTSIPYEFSTPPSHTFITPAYSTPPSETSPLLRLFRMLKLFPSVGTKVVKHYSTV